MALALVESRAFAKFPPSNILVYPTAGPAIGNLVFSELFSKRFPKVPGESYQVWNCMIVNLLDPIAQPWCTSKEKSPKQNLHNIPDIFGKSAPPIPEVLTGVNLGQYLANASTITYIPIQAAWFEGTPPSSPPADLGGFLALTWPQHTDELLNLMGDDELQRYREEDNQRQRSGLTYQRPHENRIRCVVCLLEKDKWQTWHNRAGPIAKTLRQHLDGRHAIICTDDAGDPSTEPEPSAKPTSSTATKNKPESAPSSTKSGTAQK
ncbi:unnamed protein product [Rhizoctonia solani]|uniref:Fungal lipase-like domain-containing protein n=1 Tax=Rhizoctonia solani TaxID=456999 RepID=A0A8H3HVS5_9AGAM|nr:unnamed protein product [Rhizoctonia solani]